MQKLNRRRFGLAAGAALAGCSTNATAPADPDLTAGGKPASGPPVDDLEKALEKPILDLSGLDEPVIIDSLRLLEKDGEQFVHVRSKDGAEGVSLTNNRDYFYPVLAERMAPFFTGKDARKIESDLLWDLYREGSNYKLQGLVFWSVQAWGRVRHPRHAGTHRGQVNRGADGGRWCATRSTSTSPAADGTRRPRKRSSTCRA